MKLRMLRTSVLAALSIMMVFIAITEGKAKTTESDPVVLVRKVADAVLRDNPKRPWLTSAKTCMDTLIKHGTDTYGTVSTPMLMSIINVNTLTSPEDPLKGFTEQSDEDIANDVFYDACMRTEGRPLHGRLSPGGSNAWLDQPLIRAMYLCSDMTSDTSYSDAADAYMSYFMANCKKANGIFYWGSHSYWHAFNEAYSGDGQHEILIVHPDWENLYRLNPSAVTAEIEGIWDRHICNKTTGEHNRHDSGACGLDFAMSGGSYAMAFSSMYAETGNSTWLDRAKLIANRHWNNRNTTTNLVADAPAAKNKRFDGNHCMTSVTGPFASKLLKCYELTGDTLFRDQAVAYIKAYDKYGWDSAAGTYWGTLKLDGTPVPGPRGVGENSDYSDYTIWEPRGHVDLWRTEMYGYEFPLIAAQAAIYAYEQSNDVGTLTAAEHWAKVIEDNMPAYLGRWWADEIKATMPDVIKTGGTYAENYGRAISFFIHIYRATKDKKYLKLAESLATEAVEKLYTNGIFKGHPAKPYYQSNDGVGFLVFALLELDQPEHDFGGAF
jgi:hypothetical protein